MINIAAYLRSHPLMLVSILMAIGIALGRHGDMLLSFSYTTWCIVTILAALTTAVLSKSDRIAGIGIVLTAIAFGAALITMKDSTANRNHQDGNASKGYHAYYNKRYSHYNKRYDQYDIRYSASQHDDFANTREELTTTLRNCGMDGDALAITAAMTLGNKSMISNDMQKLYRDTGASHVFALSGMHLGIIFMLMAGIARCTFARTRQKRQWADMAALPIIWWYVMLVGGRPSVVRAAIMITIYVLSKLTDRKPAPIDVLVFAAFITLVIYPQWLFDVGFQMSYMAMFGIVFIYSGIYHQINRQSYMNIVPQNQPLGMRLRSAVSNSRIVRYFWGIFCVGMAAQIGVTPLVVYYFGYLSPYSLLTNFIVSPLAIVIISLGILLLLTGWPFIAPILTRCIDFQNYLLRSITHLPYSTINDIHISALQTLLIYIFSFCIILLIRIFWTNRTKDYRYK